MGDSVHEATPRRTLGGSRVEHFIVGDALRGIAAIFVFTFHAAGGALTISGDSFGVALARSADGYLDAYGMILGTVILTGPFGFLVFFVLSGYLVGSPFVQSLIDGSRRPSLGAYAVNRVLRVGPAYWTALTILTVIVVVFLQWTTLSPGKIAELYMFQTKVENPVMLGVAWTLWIEIRFYLLLPIAAIVSAPLLRRLPSPTARAIAIATPCLIWFVAATFVYGDRSPAGQPFPYYLRMLAIGVAIAAFAPTLRARAAGNPRWARAALVSFSLSAICVLVAGGLYSFGFDTVWGSLLFDAAAVNLVLGPLVWQWATGGSWRLLDNPLTRWLGSRSYSIYLVHTAFLVWIALEMKGNGYGYQTSFAVLMTVALALSLLAAEILHRAVERPFLQRKARRARARARAADSAAREGRASDTVVAKVAVQER